MRVFFKGLLILGAAILCGPVAVAVEVPKPGENDARVRYVTYKKDEVIEIHVRRGALTRIVLGTDEAILKSGTAFPADCEKAEFEWCVIADKGDNQVWVKPKDGATHNNLELRTDKRDYSIEFMVLPDKEGGRGNKPATAKTLESEPMFRVIFRYPLPLPPASALLAGGMGVGPVVNEKAILEERLAKARPEPRNWSYSMQVLEGADEIAPSLVFDNGRFTYFRFAANREIPTIYYVSPTGEESRVAFDVVGDDLVEVQRVGRRFVLRLGQAVVGIWNDAYDPDGVPAKDGTTVPGVVRTLRSKE